MWSPVPAPRVNDKRVDPETNERQRFSSKILPAWSRNSPKVAEVLPLLYLHGLSSQYRPRHLGGSRRVEVPVHGQVGDIVEAGCDPHLLRHACGDRVQVWHRTVAEAGAPVFKESHDLQVIHRRESFGRHFGSCQAG